MFPEIVGPDLLDELVTMTPISRGSGPSGGGVLLPGSVLHPAPQLGVPGLSAKPLKLRGAGPPVSELTFAHCAPQNITELPTTAFLSPMTNAPPPGAKASVQMTVTVFELIVEPVAFVMDACTVSVPGFTLEYGNVAIPLTSVTPVPAVPASGPDVTLKSTATPDRGFPQVVPPLLVYVAVTLAVVATDRVWLGGARLRFCPAQGPLPTGTHCVDSLLPGGQLAGSMPPVLMIWPLSV